MEVIESVAICSFTVAEVYVAVSLGVWAAEWAGSGSWRVCVSAPLAWESKAGYCVSHRHGSVSWRVRVSTPRARRSSDRLQSFTPPGLCELAGVCVSAACSEKQRLLRVSHRHGSVSWRVCVSAACSEKQRLLRVSHRQGSVSWQVCASAACSSEQRPVTVFHTARAL